MRDKRFFCPAVFSHHCWFSFRVFIDRHHISGSQHTTKRIGVSLVAPYPLIAKALRKYVLCGSKINMREHKMQKCQILIFENIFSIIIKIEVIVQLGGLITYRRSSYLRLVRKLRCILIVLIP